MARYWLFTAIVGLTLVVWIHFAPSGVYEAPVKDIYGVYGSPLVGLLALGVLTGLVINIVMLGLVATQALRSTTRS